MKDAWLFFASVSKTITSYNNNYVLMNYKKYLKISAQYLLILFITFSLLEVTLLILYKNTSLVKNIAPLKQYFKKYYSDKRSIVHLNKDCFRYDKNLTYTLQEGECNFVNEEFSQKYDLNKRGFHDDEASLVKPKIIALGDSFTMGWGVGKGEDFPFLIEKQTGLKVLNAGTSSYGTAREFLTLQNLDKSNLDYLVIQYCPNDHVENKSFVKNDFVLKVTPEKKFNAIVERYYEKSRSYRAFDLSVFIIRNALRVIKGKQKQDPFARSPDEFKELAQILEKISGLLDKKTKIILFELNSHNQNNDGIYQYFKNSQINNLTVFDVSKILDESDYFFLDDHINKKGHQKVAKKISQIIDHSKK